MGGAESLYQKYSPVAFSKAFRMLKNREDASDVVQEVMLKIFANPNKFSEVEQKIAWVYRVTTNLCLNIIRSTKLRRTDLSETLDHLACFEDLEKAYGDADLMRGVIQKLPAQLHTTFIYYFIDGMTQDEIAEVEGISRITVARYLNKIKGILRLKEKAELEIKDVGNLFPILRRERL